MANNKKHLQLNVYFLIFVWKLHSQKKSYCVWFPMPWVYLQSTWSKKPPPHPKQNEFTAHHVGGGLSPSKVWVLTWSSTGHRTGPAPARGAAGRWRSRRTCWWSAGRPAERCPSRTRSHPPEPGSHRDAHAWLKPLPNFVSLQFQDLGERGTIVVLNLTSVYLWFSRSHA